MQLCYFNFLMRILAVLSNRSFLGFVPELFISQVQYHITWATAQTYWIRKLMHMWQQIQKYQFLNLGAC